MKRAYESHTLLSVLVFVALVCGGSLSRAGEPTDLPAPLKPYADLVERCQRWYGLDHNRPWRVVYTARFGHDPARWAGLHKWAKVVHVHGRTELHLAPPENTNMAIPIGPAVSGEFAIEAVCRGDGRNPLSLMTSELRGSGPALQMNMLHSGRHCIWREPQELGKPSEKFVRQGIGTEPKLMAGRSYTLRLEVRRDHGIAGYLDGRRLASAPVSPHYDWKKRYQPHALTVGPTMAIERWRVEVYDPKPNDPKPEVVEAVEEERWRQTFGDTTREQVAAKLEGLVEQLAHDAWPVRESAERMLRQAGEFSGPALRRAAKADSPELVMRARRLLRTLPAPPAPHPPRAPRESRNPPR